MTFYRFCIKLDSRLAFEAFGFHLGGVLAVSGASLRHFPTTLVTHRVPRGRMARAKAKLDPGKVLISGRRLYVYLRGYDF